MKIGMTLVGDLQAALKAEIEAGKAGVSAGIAAAGNELKQDWRGQVVAAGLGRRLGNTIRSASYPKGRNSLNAAALVWTNAPKLIAAHEDGALIQSNDGFWLAIPTEAAGKKAGGAKMTPNEWEQRRGLALRFVYRRGKLPFLVAEARLRKSGLAVESKSKSGRGVATVPIFILVPQVTLKKRLNLRGSAERVMSSVPGHILRAWDAQSGDT